MCAWLAHSKNRKGEYVMNDIEQENITTEETVEAENSDKVSEENVTASESANENVNVNENASESENVNETVNENASEAEKAAEAETKQEINEEESDTASKAEPSSEAAMGAEKEGRHVGREERDRVRRHELRKAQEEIEALKAQVSEWKAQADKLKAQAEDITRKWYAVSAEYENYRRRTQNQAAQRYNDGRSDVVSALFPIGDNLERALAACGDEKTKQGIEMVIKSYKKLLESEGVEELDPTGQPFDSAVAEAIMAVAPAEGEESGIVKQVYVKGYKRGDKVLRYAQVIVTQ
jgi:molecular chaperone GrpE